MTTVVLVHGAFAESASWNGVIERLHDAGVDSVAVANPLRSLAGDATYVRDVIKSIEGPVVLAGHSYGGSVWPSGPARRRSSRSTGPRTRSRSPTRTGSPS